MLFQQPTYDQMKSFGDLVQERRQEQELKQEELARDVGISRNYLSQIERGVATNLSWDVRSRIATKLGIVLEKEVETLKEETLKAHLPPKVYESLKKFVEEENLPPRDIAMLARIEYRGDRPETPEQWRMLYSVIKSLKKK